MGMGGENLEGRVPAFTCWRCDERLTPEPGSWPGQCCRCGEAVWVTPGQLDAAARIGALPICRQCVPEDAIHEGPLT